jgi:ribonuclease HI
MCLSDRMETVMQLARPSESQTVVVFTDGACLGNPGPGGYGVVVLKGERRTEVFGGFRNTTNNRMEIMAAIVGLELLESRSSVILYTDSKYLQEAITRSWAQRWRANGWKTEKGMRLNYDLWNRLIDLCNKQDVEFVWIPGHSGNVENERCDIMATRAASADDLPVDIGYQQQGESNICRIREGYQRRKQSCGHNAGVRCPRCDSRALRKTTDPTYKFGCDKCGRSFVTLSQPCQRSNQPNIRKRALRYQKDRSTHGLCK